MMGGKTPETCWAVNKRQDNKLKNCCIWLVIYFNCTMMRGLTDLKSTRSRYLLDMLGGSQGQCGGCAEERYCLHMLGINPRLLSLPAPTIVTVPLIYSCCLHLQPEIIRQGSLTWPLLSKNQAFSRRSPYYGSLRLTVC